MPTYTETKTAITENVAQIKLIEGGIDKNKDLGSGYSAEINFNPMTGMVKVRLEGPQLVINKIPEVIVIRHAQVLNKVRRWLNDEEPDFPVL